MITINNQVFKTVDHAEIDCDTFLIKTECEVLKQLSGQWLNRREKLIIPYRDEPGVFRISYTQYNPDDSRTIQFRRVLIS